MSAPLRRRPASPMRHAGAARPALRYARNLHAATDRGLLEAAALARWACAHAASLGLPEARLPDGDTPGRSRGRGVGAEEWRTLGRLLGAAEARATDDAGGIAAGWLHALAAALHLDPVETAVAELALDYRLDRRVERLFDEIVSCRGGAHIFHRDTGLIAALLGACPARVEACLAPDARLFAGGLLHVETDGDIQVLERVVSLIKRGVGAGPDPRDRLLGAVPEAPLPWEAFAHLGREAETAATVLRAALAGGERGVGVLLYGPPGTGKTSFAAALAARAGAVLRPVAEADEDGDEPSRHGRLAGLRLAQRLAAPGGTCGDTLLLFDEAEDLFTGRGGRWDERARGSRVFVHRLLERLAVPVIWTANDIEPLGPAVLRRMTMCLELRVPSPPARTRLWREMGAAEGVALPEADAARLARLVPAAPAVARTALRGARLVGGGAETARLIVEGVARAVNGGALPAPEPDGDDAYDPALVNADCDLDALAARLARPGATRAVSFLLLGPPGTGKSAWVRHLAARMEMPVLHKRASDLLDAFVGGTEHNIARAFAEARDEGAFLVFDEADGLLMDRAAAVRGWEVSQVNEMLTWMEHHPLPFACTTNLPERLDRASLRRFLVKARFGWLTPAQARLAFRRFYDLPPPAALDGLHALAPADFALVRRRAEVAGTSGDADALVGLLAAECDGRIGDRGPIGFARPAAG